MDAADRWLMENRPRKKKHGRIDPWIPHLASFWHRFHRARSIGDRIALLQQMAEIVIPNPSPYRKRRAKFRMGKKFRKHFIHGCQVCTDDATQRHHIITLKNGGPNSHDNIIGICDRCHALVHPWMDIAPQNEMAETMARVAREA